MALWPSAELVNAGGINRHSLVANLTFSGLCWSLRHSLQLPTHAFASHSLAVLSFLEEQVVETLRWSLFVFRGEWIHDSRRR